MQLISLSANQDTFKTVRFANETGINLIVANKTETNKSDKSGTTNGVGKSLLIAIIHFCLGSSTKKGFKDKLQGWEFCLTFKIKGETFTAKRSTDNQKKIFLNGEEYIIKKFNTILEDLLFDIPDGVGELSFRSLIPFFIRPRRASFTSETDPNAINKDYQVQITNALLLGVDVTLAEQKFKLKKEKTRITTLIKDLKNDRFIHSFFAGDNDITLQKSELEDKIATLQKNLQDFKVADDYYDIKDQADDLKKLIDTIQKEKAILQIQVANINESLTISTDIKRESIEKIYKEASVIIKDEAIKQLSELEKFYTFISENRTKRLLDQRSTFQNKIIACEKDLKINYEKLDAKLKYLDAHQALDIFINLSNQLSDIKTQKENLLKFEELFAKYNDEVRTIDQTLISANSITEKYLNEAEEIKNRTNLFFRSIVKRFYPSYPAGITIYNNDGVNQLRYTIEAKIETDKSDGIGHVKLFSYDLTLLLKGYNHQVNFLFHDSRLLDGIDPRQKYQLFLALNEYISPSEKQYILTLNYNQLDEIKDYFSEEEYKRIITDNIILSLADSSPEAKLLGIQVDLDYD